MERQLLLASNIAGIKLSSSLASGTKEGATRLIIEADHKILSGGLTLTIHRVKNWDDNKDKLER